MIRFGVSPDLAVLAVADRLADRSPFQIVFTVAVAVTFTVRSIVTSGRRRHAVTSSRHVTPDRHVRFLLSASSLSVGAGSLQYRSGCVCSFGVVWAVTRLLLLRLKSVVVVVVVVTLLLLIVRLKRYVRLRLRCCCCCCCCRFVRSSDDSIRSDIVSDRLSDCCCFKSLLRC